MMATYSVHTKDASAGDLTLVRDGFCLPAFLFGPFWFAWRRAWLGATIWVLGVAGIGVLTAATGAPELPAAAATVAFMLLMAMEAGQFRRRALTRRGYKLADVVEARGRNEADIRFLARSISQRTRNEAQPGVHRLPPQRVENVGLFLNGT